MKHISLIPAFFLCAMVFGQQQPKEQPQVPAQGQPPAQSQQQSSTPAQSKPCVIVQHEGGHTFRNVMLLGVAGAVISKERYKVIESNVAGLAPGEKMHGDELQARTQGAKVVVVKKNSQDELQSARDACSK